jgi:uncharacterized protein YjiS (DUF1127 family)
MLQEHRTGLRPIAMLQCNIGRSKTRTAMLSGLVVVPSTLLPPAWKGESPMVTPRNDPASTNASSIESPIGRTGARLAGGLVLWLRALNTRHQLRRLSDRALADIGTTRAGIPLFAKHSDPWQRLPGDAVFILALGNLIERIESWRDRRRRQLQVHRELAAYTDRELSELGLSRREIPKIARMT